MSVSWLRHLGAAFVIVALLAAAPPGEKDAQTVQVSVFCILASEKDDKIDAKLACIARQVRKKDAKLTGFRMAGTMSRKSLTVGVKESFDLIDDHKAVITVQHGADDKDRVEVKVAPPNMGEITYNTCCGKFLPLFTPIRTKNNELLILAVRVQPCRRK